MLAVVIASGFLLLIGFIYLIIAHYILAIEIEEDIKKTPPDVKLLPLDTKK